MAEDPHIPNYDPRAPGHPLLLQRIAAGRCCERRRRSTGRATRSMWPAASTTVHGETSYQEMLDHFRDYTDVVGDNPMNLGATTLGLHGLRADRRDEVPRLGARVRRRVGRADRGERRPASHQRRARTARSTAATAGTAASTAGGSRCSRSPCADRWPTATRRSSAPCTGSATRSLLTGERRYVDLWRRMLDLVNANAKEEDGEVVYPHMYGRLDRLDRLQQGGTIDDLPAEGPEGWYEFRPEQVRAGRRRAVLLDARPFARSTSCPRRRAGCGTWTARTSRIPKTACRPTSKTLRTQGRADARRRSHAGHDDVGRPERHQPGDDGRAGPADAGWPPGRPERLPAALPAALLRSRPAPGRAARSRSARWWSASTEDEVTVQLVNLDPVTERTVIVQGGAYAEHQITDRPGRRAARGRRRSITRTSPSGSRRAPGRVS